MKKSNLPLMLFAVMFGLSLMINAQDNTGISQNNTAAKSKSFNVNKGGTLNVQITSGDIKITTSDKNEVNIKIASEDKEDINNITATLENNTVKIRNNYSSWGGWTGGDISLNISIPSEFNIDINTQSGDVTENGNLKGTATIFTAGGDIMTGDISGRTNLKSSGGDITTGNIGSGLQLSTNGGDVKTGSVGGKAEINTMGGSINVVSAGKDLVANTMGGDISIGNVGGTADVKTMGGSVGIGKVLGNTNINTYGGDISLSGARGKIDANTYGGNINLKDIQGSINADTKSGDVYIELNPSGDANSNIKSMNGNITLYLSANAKANIHATIVGRGFNKYMDKNPENMIRSDFESKTFVNEDKSDKIEATYVINGGGPKIDLYSVNGSIEIRKK
jgi:Toastrack DUF4097